MFADKPWLYFQNLFQEKKNTRKKHYWKNCQISENSKNDIRTTSNKPYRTKRELTTPISRSTTKRERRREEFIHGNNNKTARSLFDSSNIVIEIENDDLQPLLHSDMPLYPGVYHCVVPNFGWLNMLFQQWKTQKP